MDPTEKQGVSLELLMLTLLLMTFVWKETLVTYRCRELPIHYSLIVSTVIKVSHSLTHEFSQ